MGMFPVNAVGEVGVILDLKPHELPPNAWTACRNVRFNSSYLEKFAGKTSLWGGASIAPYFLMNARDVNQNFWLYAGLSKVYVTDGNVHTDISRTVGGAYGATADIGWTGCVLNGVPILNNGIDVPQFWALPMAPATKLTTLSNWNVNWKANALRSYKNFLVALDVTKTGTRYQQMVKWSHPADPGAVPSSWDETDATKDAGEFSLSESTGACLDSVPLRDTNIIYKDDSIWGMQWVGGQFVHRFYGIVREMGALSRKCAVEFIDGQHVVFGAGDLFVHNGQSAKSIASQRIKRTLFSQISGDYFQRSFVVHNEPKKEVWFCYSETGQAVPNKALVWGYDKESFGFRDISAAHIAAGVINASPTTLTWNGDSGTWDTDTAVWDTSTYDPSLRRLLEASPNDSKLFFTDDTQQFDNVDMTSYVERTGLAVATIAGQPPDMSGRKFVRKIWPRITGTAGGVVNVYLGYQNTIDGPVTYMPAKGFTIGTTQHLDFRVPGRLFAVKFESTSNIAWKLHGYELDVVPLGQF